MEDNQYNNQAPFGMKITGLDLSLHIICSSKLTVFIDITNNLRQDGGYPSLCKVSGPFKNGCRLVRLVLDNNFFAR